MAEKKSITQGVPVNFVLDKFKAWQRVINLRVF
jgi:hypothetical protein